jgi:hypothetical protein
MSLGQMKTFKPGPVSKAIRTMHEAMAFGLQRVVRFEIRDECRLLGRDRSRIEKRDIVHLRCLLRTSRTSRPERGRLGNVVERFVCRPPLVGSTVKLIVASPVEPYSAFISLALCGQLRALIPITSTFTSPSSIDPSFCFNALSFVFPLA